MLAYIEQNLDQSNLCDALVEQVVEFTDDEFERLDAINNRLVNANLHLHLREVGHE